MRCFKCSRHKVLWDGIISFPFVVQGSPVYPRLKETREEAIEAPFLSTERIGAAQTTAASQLRQGHLKSVTNPSQSKRKVCPAHHFLLSTRPGLAVSKRYLMVVVRQVAEDTQSRVESCPPVAVKTRWQEEEERRLYCLSLSLTTREAERDSTACGTSVSGPPS